MSAPDLHDLAERVARISADLKALQKTSGSSLPGAPVPEQGQGVMNAVPTATPVKPPVLMTGEELCEMLQIDPRTLRRWRHEGSVPAPLQIGSVLRWRRAEVEAWLAKGAKPTRRAIR